MFDENLLGNAADSHSGHGFLLALHKKIAERNAQILYRGTEVKSYNEPAAIRG